MNDKKETKLRQNDTGKFVAIDKSKLLMPVLNQGLKPDEVFNPDLKAKFIENYRRSNNLTKSLQLVGVGKQSFYNQIARDKYFKELFDEALNAILDDMEQVMKESAMTHGAGGFRDRIAFLKAHRKKYNDKIEHEHTVDKKKLLSYYKDLPNVFKEIPKEVIDIKPLPTS